jgi:hypothetical protein
MNESQEINIVKVRFDSDSEGSGETIWAESIGDDLYVLRNSPLYTSGYSYGDTVLAVIAEGSEIPIVKRAVHRSGHSTFRLLLLPEISDELFQKYWKPLQDIGCALEGMKEYYFAVDIPPDAIFESAFSLLEKGKVEKVWAFSEGYSASKKF